MAGAEKLIKKILGDAQSDADRYLRDAEEKKLRMHDELMRDIDKQRNLIEKEAEAAAKENKRRLAAVNDLEYRKQVLAAKQEMMSRARKLAFEMLRSVSDAEYIALMKKKLIGCAKTGGGTIAVSKRERRLDEAFLSEVNAELKKTAGRGEVAFSPKKRLDIAGGFIYTDGGMEINVSLEALLEEAWRESEADAAKLLFE
jgi:V/A-type H+-transporting ATPase subunit E